MRINALGNTATDFASDDYIALDGETNGSRKMKNDSLLKVTAQNALAGNVAPAFDPTRDEDHKYLVGDNVVYEGKVYTFKTNHYGSWDVEHVEPFSLYVCDEKLNYDFLDGGVADFGGTTDGQGVRSDFNTPFYSENLSCSDYILCFGAKNITFLDMVNTTSGGLIGYAFYDKGKKVITGAERSHGEAQGAVERVVDVPKGAYFFRSTYWSSTKRDSLGLDDFYAKVQYEGLAKSSDIEKINDCIDCIKSKNVKVVSEIEALNTTVMYDNVVNAVTGLIGSSENFNACVLFIPDLAQFVKVPMKCRTQNTKLTGIAFYGEDGTFISGEGTFMFSDSADMEAVIEIPSGAKKIAVSVGKNLDLEDVKFSFYLSCETKKKTIIRYDNQDCCDGYFPLLGDGNMTSAWSNNFGCFDKIPCKGAYKLTARLPIYFTDTANGIVFYDELGTYIIGRKRKMSTNSSEIVEVIVPTNAAFVSVLAWNYDKQSDNGGEPYVELHYMGDVALPKREKKSGQIHFSVVVDQSVTNWWKDDGDMNSPSLSKSTCVLTLPDDYTPNGKPCKLMVWCHGNSRNVSLIQWGLNNEAYLAQKERFRVAGYAVLDCNGPRDNSGRAISYAGCPQGVMAYLKAIQFAVDNYNLDPTPYIVGASAGGLTASSLAAIIPSKCLCYMSPNLSHKSWWDHNGRDVFADFFGFTDKDVWEEDKAVGWDIKSKIVSGAISAIYPRVMLFVGDAETEGVFWPDMQDVISAVRAGGGYAGLHICENADHGITNGQFPAVDQQVINWLNRF